jgi:putative transposase
MPAGLDVHLVMDNYATHKTPKVKAWLARRTHWHVHFTPTSVSWINQVEPWFAELTRKQLLLGLQRSTAELEADILALVEAHNENPKPYRWTKSADEILASVKRFCQKTMSRTSNSGD